MKKLYAGIFLLLNISLFSGCSVKDVMIGEEDFSCSNSNLEDAGICGSATYIYRNIDLMEKQAYRGFKKENGIYTKCSDCEKD